MLDDRHELNVAVDSASENAEKWNRIAVAFRELESIIALCRDRGWNPDRSSLAKWIKPRLERLERLEKIERSSFYDDVTNAARNAGWGGISTANLIEWIAGQNRAPTITEETIQTQQTILNNIRTTATKHGWRGFVGKPIDEWIRDRLNALKMIRDKTAEQGRGENEPVVSWIDRTMIADDLTVETYDKLFELAERNGFDPNGGLLVDFYQQTLDSFDQLKRHHKAHHDPLINGQSIIDQLFSLLENNAGYDPKNDVFEFVVGLIQRADELADENKRLADENKRLAMNVFNATGKSKYQILEPAVDVDALEIIRSVSAHFADEPNPKRRRVFAANMVSAAVRLLEHETGEYYGAEIQP